MGNQLTNNMIVTYLYLATALYFIYAIL